MAKTRKPKLPDSFVINDFSFDASTHDALIRVLAKHTTKPLSEMSELVRRIENVVTNNLVVGEIEQRDTPLSDCLESLRMLDRSATALETHLSGLHGRTRSMLEDFRTRLHTREPSLWEYPELLHRLALTARLAEQHYRKHSKRGRPAQMSRKALAITIAGLLSDEGITTTAYRGGALWQTLVLCLRAVGGLDGWADEPDISRLVKPAVQEARQRQSQQGT